MESFFCFSHLRWNFVWQRPQHLLSQLAADYKVYFVEEPVTSSQIENPFLECTPAEGSSNIEIVRLVVPSSHDHWIGHGDTAVQPVYNQLLSQFMRDRNIKQPLIWFYTPMAHAFLEIIPDYRLMIYDVMDQLAAFKGAPVELIEREKDLLRQADIVLTGGLSLYRNKLPYNPKTYLFPSGVDIEHFAAAANPANFEKPADIERLPQPVLGYFGVIDERMDLTTLAFVAQNRPDWTILMIGPTVKIDPADLPKAANIHYLGMRSYNELPAYLAYFDVSLVPFAMNEATEFLSPTKTLEYLAAGKPVVATPINDIVELYGEVVTVCNSPAEFVSRIEAILAGNLPQNAARITEILNESTWDSIGGKIRNLIKEELAGQLTTH